MLYFAYGSNMNWMQMRERCPSVRFVGVAALADHRLAFTRESVNRGCGVADAVREAGRRVWGVVYQVSDHDLGRLDQLEGYRPARERNSYWRRECMVFLDGDDEQPLTAVSYFAEPQANAPLPSRDYKDLILAGAQHWHLPADYVAELEGIEVAG